MRHALVVSTVILFVYGAAGTATADILADFATLTNGNTTIFSDHFDDGVLDPNWQQIGTPGPEHDTYVDLGLGDGLFVNFATNPAQQTLGTAFFDIAAAAPDTAAILMLTGSQVGDFLAVAVGQDGAVCFDESGVLGAIALPAVQTVEVTVGVAPDGNGGALVNGTAVYAGPVSFGTVAGYVISYAPEPSMFALLALSSLVVSRIRRSASRWVA